ncbi:nicotinate (nicotinamide) nucleotide adenylyltransferase [Parabacteroides sp. Marseille-P3160]|uniref:nicotinate (nicotinamide) nucleotide adenylyltransferase n=1 Tax=Parabacteroides sp. Marseille-P3160 TaxID=1917887 RepID=UPI0009BBFD2A|nr:nicotinate (nicotinamide) nucleotide adenylyltransferase [Parabacteroides sp. Marseille-P3160]
MKKTGIYSGSFNPIHIGHLAIANWICEYTDTEEVWFLVSPRNPLKEAGELMEEKLRLAMVEAAIGDYPKFSVSDIEFSLPRPSYTIDTLRTLRSTYPDRSFQLIIGSDSWAQIDRWKQYDELIREFPLLIYPRKDYPIEIPEGCPTVRGVDAPLLEISSTHIRQALRAGKDIRFFLPEPVRPFLIEQLRLPE